MLKIATIKHNELKTRMGIYLKNNSLFFKENGQYLVIDESKNWTTSRNYIDVCNSIWGRIWDLKFMEIQND